MSGKNDIPGKLVGCGWWVLGLGYVFLGMMLFGIFDIQVLFQLPFHLACGWIIHASQALPPWVAQWRSALLPVAAFLVAGWMLHRFIRWVIQAETRQRTWRRSHTLAAMVLLLLGYGAAITLIGIAHQTTWLFGEQWISSGYIVSQNSADARAGAAVLIDELEKFHQLHGSYPESLRELDVPRERLVMPTGREWVLESFIYLKPDGKYPNDKNKPVIVCPMGIAEDGFQVGFLLSDVRVLKWDELEKLLDPATSSADE